MLLIIKRPKYIFAFHYFLFRLSSVLYSNSLIKFPRRVWINISDGTQQLQFPFPFVSMMSNTGPDEGGGGIMSFLMAQPRPHFVYFRSFQHTNFIDETVGFSGIRTPIDSVDGKHADHLTATTAAKMDCLISLLISYNLGPIPYNFMELWSYIFWILLQCYTLLIWVQSQCKQYQQLQLRYGL